MTVPNTNTRNGPYYGNGVTTAFPFTFRAIDNSDVQVVRIASDGTISTISSALFNVTLTDNGGSAIFALPPAAGDPIYVQLDPTFSQEISFENEGAFLPEVITEALDRGAQRSLWLRELLTRTVMLPVGEAGFSLVRAALRTGGKVLGFNALTGALEVQGGGSFKGDPGGNVMSIGLKSVASTLSIPGGTDIVQTSGYDSPGVGPALYTYSVAVDAAYVAANPRSSFRSANGRGFKLAQSPLGVNVRHLGARGDGVTNDTLAIRESATLANATGAVLYAPTGNYLISDEITVRFGIVGDGPLNTIFTVSVVDRATWALNGSSATGRKAAIVVNSNETSPVLVDGFRLVGAGTRTPFRFGDADTMGFYGTGILYTGNAAFITASNIRIDFFYKGIEHDQNNGHLGGVGLMVSNCWFNLYWEKNTGDYRYFNCVFTGPLFACYGVRGSTKGGVDVGGLNGLTMIGCHGGFGPYLFYQEDGNGTVGIYSITMIQSSAEQVGNQIVRLGASDAGKRRVSGGWFIRSCGANWVPNPGSPAFDAWAISGDVNHPVQVYAVNFIDLLQIGPIDTIGDGWPVGTSGYVFNVNTAQNTMKDERGAWVFKVAEGSGYNIGTGRPYFSSYQLPQNLPVAANMVDVCSFNLPQAVDGFDEGEATFTLNTTNTTGGSQRVQVRLVFNGVQDGGYRFLDIPIGAATITFRGVFNVPRRNRAGNQFSIAARLINVPGGIAFNDGGLPTDATVRVYNNAVLF